MTPKSKMIAAILAASVSATALAQVANAEATATDTSKAVAAQTTTDGTIVASAVQVPETGQNILLGTEFAKMALADGDTKAATEILQKVSASLNDESADFLMKTNAGYSLPLETGIGFAEGFTPTDEQGPAIQQAVEQMQAGDIDAAIAVLNKAGVKLSAQIALMPFKSTADSLKQATADVENGNTEKAIAALDAIGKSITVEHFATDSVPHQGYELSDVLQS